MSQLRYRVQIYAAGVQATTGTVDFTINSSQIKGLPQMGGQRAKPLDGSMESIPWSIDVLDASSAFTAKLASTAGRLNKNGRLARIQCSTNSTASSAYGTQQIGRITDIALGQDIATYRLTLSDERVIERNTMIFTKVPAANAVALIPPGILSGFGTGRSFTPAFWTCRAIINNWVCLQLGGAALGAFAGLAVTQEICRVIVDDAGLYGNTIGANIPAVTTATHGNFQYLRFHAGAFVTSGTDYEVGGFDTVVNGTTFYPQLSYVESLKNTPAQGPIYVWVVFPSSPPVVGSNIYGFLYMPNRPPDETLPLFIGGTAGKYPFTVLEEVYQGTYSTTLPVRYSTSKMAALKNNTYGLAWWRITSPAVMSDWVEQQIYKPTFSVPTVDLQGRVAPVPLTIPSTLSPANMLTLSSANLSMHPSFENPMNEAVTRVRGRIPTFMPVAAFDKEAKPDQLTVGMFDARAGGMLGSSQLVSSNANVLGGREQALEFPMGRGLAYPGLLGLGAGYTLPALYERARSIFTRFQDGPLYARQAKCLPSVDATTRGKLAGGDYLLLSLGTYPNPRTNTRGGSRIMQIMSRQEHPTGPLFELLDAGPNITATIAPTLALAVSTMSSRHAVKMTVSGTVAVGTRWRAQLAPTSSTGAAVPAAASTRWKTQLLGGTTGVFQIGNLPSHTKFYSRIDAIQMLTLAPVSAWSSGGAAVTAKIAGPTSLKTTGITGSKATLKWLRGSSLYATDVMIDTSTAATLGTSRRVAQVTALTSQFIVGADIGNPGLTTGQKYKWGVRHVDAFGGYSTTPTAVFTATTSKGTAPAMSGRGIIVLAAG